jgi:hypothetical protein
MNDDELVVLKSRVTAAAKTSASAKMVLENLFPEAFENKADPNKFYGLQYSDGRPYGFIGLDKFIYNPTGDERNWVAYAIEHFVHLNHYNSTTLFTLPEILKRYKTEVKVFNTEKELLTWLATAP